MLNSTMTTSHNTFSAGFKGEFRQFIIAITHKISKKSAMKTAKAIIHKGKNNMLGHILQHDIRLELYL